MTKGIKISITIKKNSLLDFTIALFMCSSIIRSIISKFTGHPAAITTVLLYGLLMVSIFYSGITVKKLMYYIAPLVAVWCLIGLTWVLYPERHGFYRQSLYDIRELLNPIYGVYLTSVCTLEDRPEGIYKSLKIAAYIMGAYYAFQMLDVIQDGVWDRTSIYSGEIVEVSSNYNLKWGYNVYIVCIIFFARYLDERKKRFLLITGLGLVGIFLYGSRGPLLMFALYILMVYAFYTKRKIGKRMVVLFSVSVVVIILLITEIPQNILLTLANQYGFNSRTLEKLLNGTMTDFSGRSQIYAIILEKIRANPIFGCGIYSDRFFLNMIVQGGSAYSHNIILELCVSFGVFGLMFFGWLITRCVKYLQINVDITKRIILLIGIGGCLPLLLSLSFWVHPMFWFLLAILINNSREKRKR